MPRTERVAQHIQELAYARILEQRELDERPEDAKARPGETVPHYAAWNATSFSGYVPFRGPMSE